MGLRSTVLALALAGWGVGAEPAWAAASCDAFTAALRTGASDMGVEFSRAIVVSRARSDASVYDVTTKVDVDATLSCRGDEFVRFEARISEPANARTSTNFERFQAAALKAALGWDAAKSRGLLKGMTPTRASSWTPRASAATSMSPARPRSTCPGTCRSA